MKGLRAGPTLQPIFVRRNGIRLSRRTATPAPVQKLGVVRAEKTVERIH